MKPAGLARTLPRAGISAMCRNVTRIHIMRTNIVIDDALMADAIAATGAQTKREVVELGLKTLVRLRDQAEIKAFRGKLAWDGDLDAMRRDR